MYKWTVIMHRVMIAASAVILAASLVFYLTRWNALPERIGVHFAADGNFDVYSDRIYGFYPHIVGGVFIGGLAFAVWLAGRKKTGLGVSEKGEKLFRTELTIVLDCLALLLGCAFADWSRSVALQVPLNTDIMRLLVSAMLIIAAVGIIAEIITVRIYRTGELDKRKADTNHRLSRLVPWLLTAADALVLLLVWERLPDDDPTGYYHMNDLAYYADIDAYLTKWLMLTPAVLSAVILAVMEFADVRAEKRGNDGLVLMLDRMKVITATVFFVWNVCLLSEQSIMPVWGIFYAVLCAVVAAAYLIKRRKKQ